MAPLINKTSVATAVDSSNNFDLSNFHATTGKFYKPMVTYFHELVPDEKWNMDTRCHIECLPMIRPVVADIKVHNRFFFVPYYQIMHTFKDFINETPVLIGGSLSIPTVPIIPESRFIHLFANASYSTAGTIDDFDMQIYNAQGTRSPRKLTAHGRTVYQILLGLGYNINLSLRIDKGDGIIYSALPLLAYLKVWLDWYQNSAFDIFLDFEKYFDIRNALPQLSATDLTRIFDVITRTYYERDFFTSAMLNPYAPSNAGNSNIAIEDTSLPLAPQTRNVVVQTTSGTPAATSKDGIGVVHSVTKYTLDAVNAMTDYVKRHQLSGLQPFNRFLAEYGVALDEAEIQRSTFLGDNLTNINIDDVIATAENDITHLGEKGGIASGNGQKKLDYKMSGRSFGCIICVTTIVPRSSYTDGVKSHVLRRSRFDFFTPTYEHLGFEPVKSCMLKNNYHEWYSHGDTPAHYDPDHIFGFMPMYSGYKTATDTLSGDFAVISRKLQFEPWVLHRMFPENQYDRFATINEDFLRADPSSINSPFVSEDEDNFILYFMHHVNSRLPMHKLFDDYTFSNEVDNPKHVTIANQGVQLT